MSGWLGSMAGVDAVREEMAALKLDVASLREELAARLAEAGRQHEARIADISEQIAAAGRDHAGQAERLGELAGALEEIRSRLGDLDHYANASRGENETSRETLDSLRAALSRQEEQLKLHIAESARTWAALIERVELARLAAERAA